MLMLMEVLGLGLLWGGMRLALVLVVVVVVVVALVLVLALLYC